MNRSSFEHVAQPGQSVTHSGLAQAQALAGARHISLLHHRVEHDEQVEVERSQIHQMNIYHIIYRLEECSISGDGDEIT